MRTAAKHILDRVGAARGRSAFTLMEILIAVAALGLLAVGVAQIFDATGKTITAGRRVSAFNAYASLIEQQMRTDISRMTRDGFLVIRNEYASGAGNATVSTNTSTTNPDAVPLFDGDERPRLRRIDEFMFFAKGEFTSARTPLHPAYIARADAARIYYGHGQKARPEAVFNANDPYYLPELSGIVWGNSTYDSEARLGYDSPATPGNPNRFASDWILLRHVTLLAPPRTSEVLTGSPVFNYAPGNPVLEDSQVQVSLQPAASHIFRRLSGLFPQALPPASNVLRSGFRPSFNSGLVDIAATNLALIRTVVTTASKFPNQAGARFFAPSANVDPNEILNAGADGVYTQWGTSPSPVNDRFVIDRTQAWMDDALPSNSMAQTASERARIRCELSPRNYIGSLDRNQWSSDAEAAYRTADQIMLSSSNFLPRCTEFIVEWSFGRTWPSDPTNVFYDPDRAGEIVWHGMYRQVGGDVVSRFYDGALALTTTSTAYPRVNGSTGQHTVPTRLIHGETVAQNAPNPGAPLASYFGYFDPTFNPDADNDGKLESANDSVSPTIPWAWPKLIRVTLSLADPNDPTIERTYQFVFQVPDGV